MYFLKSASIKAKLLFITMTMTLFTLVVVAAGFTIYDVRNTKRNLAKELELLSNMMTSRIALPVKFDNRHHVQEHLGGLAFKESITIACVYDHKGQVFTFYSSDKNKLCHPLNEGFGHVYESDFISFHQQIETKGGEHVGSLYIESNLEEIRAHLLQYAFGIVVVLLTIIIFAFLLANQLQKILSVPIGRLRRTIQECVTHGDYSTRAKVSSHDEIGELAEAFNTMLHSIEARDHKLHEINADLEIKIAKERHCHL